MNNSLNKLLLASSISLALAGTGATALAQTDSNEVSNARQESQIETTYALSPYLRAHDINVVVVNGKATLTGTVDEEINKELARQIALGVSGIESVDNNIEVKADYVREARTGSERSFGEVVDDASITAAVKSKLLWSTYTDGLDTEVDTRNGVVTLTGTADSREAVEHADKMAMDTRGVRSVDNKLTISSANRAASGNRTAANSSEEGNGAGQAISDTWITTKVKSTYLMSRNIHSGDISVETKDGVVNLGGKTQSGAENALAIEIAQNIKGVKSVNAAALTF
jgi:hyperosmotically inducible periplasmic protein